MGNFLTDPCVMALNKVVVDQGGRDDFARVVNQPCSNAQCPVHGPQGIGNHMLGMLDELSDEELRDSLRRATSN